MKQTNSNDESYKKNYIKIRRMSNNNTFTTLLRVLVILILLQEVAYSILVNYQSILKDVIKCH